MSFTCFSCGIPTSLQVYLTLSIPTRMIQINQAPAYTRFTAATKKARFWNFIESVNCDIICGCETWLNPTIYDAEVLASNSNYNIHLKNRLDGHGGSLILIKDNIVSEPVKSILHVTFYSRKLNISKETVMIGSAYRPTNNNEEYSKQLCQAISQISNIFKKATIWIAGDFN